MKSTAIIFLMVTLLCSLTFGQPATQKNIRKEKIEAMKIAFISNKIQLTTLEAEKFWPVYSQYQKEMKVLNSNFRKSFSEINNFNTVIPENEMEKRLMSEMEFAQKKLDLKKYYYPKFKEAISVNKISKLYEAEKMFRQKRSERIRIRQNKIADGMR